MASAEAHVFSCHPSTPTAYKDKGSRHIQTGPQHSNVVHLFIIVVLTFLLQFEEFYTSKHNGRVLSWLHHLSVAELSMTYLKKAYTVCVSTYQMAVLLAYNQGHTHSTHSLGQLTRLPSQELSSTIQSLLDSKILESTRSKAGEGEGEGDKPAQYMLNMNYANKRTKFKITAMLHKDTPQVSNATPPLIPLPYPLPLPLPLPCPCHSLCSGD